MQAKLTLAAAALAVSAPAHSQEVVSLPDYDHEALYGGIRAEEMLDADVYGAAGEEIGEVENIIVGADGRITDIVVEAGGFLDIGDTHFRVPWNEVDLTPGVEGVAIPIVEERAEEYGLFDEGYGEVVTGPREFKITELLDDYARLTDVAGYGYVSDVVFNPEGEIEGVLVNRQFGYGGGLYGYPYYGYDHGFDPGRDYYGLPYAEADVGAYEGVIDVDRFDEALY